MQNQMKSSTSSFPPIAMVKASSYEEALIAQAVERLFSELSISSALFEGKKVLIKPNLLMRRRPEEATTTHPQVVLSVIEWIKRAGAAEIVLADSPGGLYTPSQLRSIYSACGMEDVAKKSGCVLNLETGSGTVASKNAKLCQEFNLIDPVRKADVIVSVGKLKTHCMTGLSGGVKNLFGCIPGLQKPQLHYRYQNKREFCSMLVDLAQTVAPVLTIMDAVESMEGNGPSGGSVRKTGFLIASQNPFCLDRFLCDLIAMTTQQVPTVAESIQRGLWPEKSEDLLILNPDALPTLLRDYRHPQSKTIDFSGNVPSFLQPAVRWTARHLLSPKPIIDTQKCIGCGKCAESCPPHTIQIQNRKAQIQYKNCIRCYCCHEMCPVKAIHIKGRS